MLGISVYLGNDPEKNSQWIEKAGSYGFTKIFTSLHIPEEDASLLRERLILLGKAAGSAGMEIMADAGPRSLKNLGISINKVNELRDWNITGLRADYGFSDEEIVGLSHVLKVGLNASTIVAEMVDTWKTHGLRSENVEAWHNFYPRQNTGISSSFLKEKNRFLKEQGFKTVAFVPGDKTLRGPVHEGLPTLEKHRGEDPFISAVELNSLLTDHIVIGDVEATDFVLKRLSDWKDGVIALRTSGLDEAFMAKVHTNRQDAARDVIRSVESRSYASANGIKAAPQVPPAPRPAGSITIDNEQYGRYTGELQITKRDLPADERVNVLGRVREEDLKLLAHIGPGQKFLMQ
ncbi:DUF871 domain-containing protein [Fictibacillus fluitans]|uniref:MupG family TIM beta-alpha barrel fold protein n=1 Tax=Fictibacillus fluitans TaxID=3058422 RepID=A0ABT8I0E6_9BACL|nr:MupG family TIM beta-alpha barrel fold protein [Fictibacillus sp. NE201]MDN4526498.1 MupG family TIM beta-alpha barrel fold protein [Fictibacillus sp. NE201]